MKNIPQEIDDLMWAIAEEGEDTAVYQFEERYPKYRDELLKRLKTVQALRTEGKIVPQRSVPKFKPQGTAPLNLRFVYSLAAIVVGCIAVAGYAVVRSNQPAPVANQSAPLPETSPVGVVQNNQNQVTPPANNPNQDQRPQIYSSQNPDPQNNGTNQGNNPPPVVPQNPPASSYEPVSPKKTLRLESATLHSAIQLICASGNLTVTIAPGTPNPEIKLDFQDMTAMEMLKALGEDYAFKPIVDGERAILILPMKDE